MVDTEAERAGPTLIGARMAVAAYFPFDNRVLDGGTRADWSWAMAQWDRVAQARQAVRLVIADRAYSGFDLDTQEGQERTITMQNKFAACRAVEQLMFGYVYGGEGKIPRGAPGERCQDPLNPDRQVPCVGDQIDAWHQRYGDQIDGIYVDSGPRDCTDPAKPGSNTAIPSNYRDYVNRIRERGYLVFLQAAQYPDNQPGNPWLQNLGADYLNLWEGGVLLYRAQYQALDFCDPEQPGIGVPGWWDPGLSLRYSRVHVIDDCRDAEMMRQIAQLAIEMRGAWTIWITGPHPESNLGSVFDRLPPYWDEEVSFFFDQYVQEKTEKDNKDNKDNKEAKDQKDQKEQKDRKEQKEEKDQKEQKDRKEAKEEKDQKPEQKEGFRKEKEHDLPQIVRSSQASQKPTERTADIELRLAVLEKEVAEGRTFIREGERPPIGEQTVADPGEEETDPDKEES